MKNYLFSVLGLFIFSQHALSQSQDSTSVQPMEAINYSGGFGHFFTGIAWIEPSDLVSHLQEPGVLGPSFNWDNVGIHSGIEGFAEIHNLLVGGGGFATFVQNMEGETGTVRFSIAGGYAKIGYVVFQQPNYFLSLNAGFGGGVMYVGIENTSENTPIYFSENFPVFPNQDEDYFRGFLLYDFNVANKIIATQIDPNRRKFGGLMFGLDLGASIGIPVDTWRDDQGSVTGIPSPGTFVSPYLRLTIGGGGFRKHYPY